LIELPNVVLRAVELRRPRANAREQTAVFVRIGINKVRFTFVKVVSARCGIRTREHYLFGPLFSFPLFDHHERDLDSREWVAPLLMILDVGNATGKNSGRPFHLVRRSLRHSTTARRNRSMKNQETKDQQNDTG
jgi:hypothetical protein